MDSVLEYPETNEDDEQRREEEMESLYQIRLRRRQEAAERSERRRLRREARARGDHETVRILRQESLTHASETIESGSAAMIAQHEARPRGRKVSTVEYASLGVARHDGSRVRANSNESDRPLLDAAGAPGMSGPRRPWVSAEMGAHRRGRSSASNLSMTSYGSDDHSGADDSGSELDTITPQRSRNHSRSHSLSMTLTAPESARASTSRERRGSSLSHHLTLDTLVADEARTGALPPNPPHYDTIGFEGAPPYTSPVDPRRQPPSTINGPESMMTTPAASQSTASSQIQNREPPQVRVTADQEDEVHSPYRLPSIRRLPSIQITEGTPIETTRRQNDDFPDFSTY